MAELGKLNYNAGYPNNQAGFSSLTEEQKQAKLETIKQHAQKNPVGALANNVSSEEETPEDKLRSFLYGAATVIGLGSIINWFASGNSYKENPVASGMRALDNFAQNKISSVNNFFNGISQRFKSNSIVQHFAKHANDYGPLHWLAKQSSRSIEGELIGDMISKTRDLYDMDGKRPYVKILDEAKEQVAKGAYKKQAYQKAVDTALTRIRQTLGSESPDVFNNLDDGARKAYEKAYQQYQTALKSGNEAKIASSAKSLLNKIPKTMGKYNSNALRFLFEEHKRMNVTAPARKEVLTKLIKKMGNLAGASDEAIDRLINKKGHQHALNWSIKLLKRKGIYGNLDEMLLKSNKLGLFMNKAGSFLSSGLKGFYAAASRAFKPADFMGWIFIGKTVKDTVDAPKGEKLSTFMEGMFGEVIPYWTMMNLMTRTQYNIVGGLRTFGENAKSFISKAASAPVRWAGNILGLGLDGKMTYQMKPSDASKLFTKTANGITSNAALSRFKEIQNIISSGQGGPRSFLERIFSGDLRFWKGASPVWKEMRALLNNNTSSITRKVYKLRNFGGSIIRIGLVIGALMPLASSVLKKVSHTIFGKPTKTKEAEERKKAAENAESAEQSQTQQAKETENDLSPMTRRYLQEIYGKNPAQNQLSQNKMAVAQPEMFNAYKNKILNNRNNPYNNQNNQQNRILANNDKQDKTIPARSLEPKSVKDYTSVPMPIATDARAKSKLNSILAETDSVISSAEKTLQDL